MYYFHTILKAGEAYVWGQISATFLSVIKNV